MTNGQFRRVERLECNECGSAVYACHVSGRKYRIACWKEGCGQSGKEYEYEQPLVELPEAKEKPE